MKQLGIFAKYWQAGAVKTRLARAIGADAASELYRVFVETLLLRFQAVADRRALCYWPPQRQGEFAALAGSAWTLDQQSDGQLGHRMSCFFDKSLNAGYTRTVLIGSDSPTLPGDYLDRAFRLLRTHSVVLGPTSDGGYYLVGAAGEVPPIFENVAWSTPRVWQQTVAALHDAAIPFAELPPWYDIDEKQDLTRLREELVELARKSPVWRELFQAVGKVRP